jgi:hypothetical protein
MTTGKAKKRRKSAKGPKKSKKKSRNTKTSVKARRVWKKVTKALGF